MNHRTRHLWLALRVRNLPLAALEVDQDEGSPAIVVERTGVVFANRAARAAGVNGGMALATAQLLSGCQVLPRDRVREEKALQQLREQLYRFSPHVLIHHSQKAPQSGVILELSTCLALFSGLKNLCDHIFAFLSSTRFEVRWGLAHTEGGAWLLSFSQQDINGDETADTFMARLNQLPVQVLYDQPEAVDALLKMGFSTLGDIALQLQGGSLASFTKRLGKGFAAFIADIYGIDSNLDQPSLFTKPVATYLPEEYFHDHIQFDYPVAVLEQLKPAFESLLHGLSDFLHKRQLACQRIQWHLADIYGNRETVEVVSDRPQNHWQLLYDLSLITFDSRPVPFEVDCLELSCPDHLPHQSHSLDMNFKGERRQRGDSREVTITMAKLKARVGDAAVHKVSYSDSLVPERSHRAVGLGEKTIQYLPDTHKHSLRPSWLFPQPQSVEQRGQRLYWQGYLTLIQGPERMQGHWWESAVARDYYLARRHDNVSLWLYQEHHSGRWYVHGVFS